MKSILLHIHDDDGLDSRIEAAIILARAFGGHITCLHVTPYHEYLAADPWTATELPADFSAKMERLRLGIKTRVEAVLEAENVSSDWIHRDEPMADAFVRHSMVSDVVVLSLPGHGANSRAMSFIAAVATKARAPVLAIPRGGPNVDIAGPALVAWDASAEASMALRSSIPLLARASAVHLLNVGGKLPDAEVSQGRSYLARHGIAARACHRMSNGDIGQTIVEMAGKTSAAMIVMGAYGHSRLTELLLGGVTRTMLVDSPAPLLLAH